MRRVSATSALALPAPLQACSPSSLTKGVEVLEDSRCIDAASTLAAALDSCHALEGPVRDALRLRLNLAAGQLGAAARDTLDVARHQQVCRPTRQLSSCVSPHSTYAVPCACRVTDISTRHVCNCKFVTAALLHDQPGICALKSLARVSSLQEEGNYKLAHAKLFGMLQQLHALGAPVPLEFRQALALLHSYVLVRSLLVCGDHMGAARMLVRVAANISK